MKTCRFASISLAFWFLSSVSAAQDDQLEFGLLRNAFLDRDYQLVIDYCTKELGKNSNHKMALWIRGLAHYANADDIKSIIDFTRLIVLDPTSATAYSNRGMGYTELELYDEAIKDYNKAIDLDPRNYRYFYNRGSAFFLKKDYDKAMKDFTQSLSLNPHEWTYNYRGACYEFKGEFDRAIMDYEEGCKINERSGWAYLRLAFLFGTCSKDTVRDGKKALYYAKKACRLANWENANCLQALACGYAENADFSKAVHWAEKALALSSQLGKDDVAEVRKCLKLFKEGKPYRRDLAAR